MHDPKKELEALQAHIEAQEEWFCKELDSAKRMIGEAPRPAKPTSAAAGVPVRNHPGAARPVRVPVQEELPAVEEAPKKKSIRGLAILALLEMLGIVGIAAYWLLFLL